MIAKIPVIATIENFAMHNNFRYDSENSSVAKFWHCSSFFHCFLRLLFPLLYSIYSRFDILHFRLAKIDRKPYEIDGNQPEFGYDWIDKIIWLPIPGKTTETASECNQKCNKDPNMSIGLIITISTQKALKTY